MSETPAFAPGPYRAGPAAAFPRPPPLHAVIEAARLDAVRSYHLLDTAPSALFDSFARQAASVLGLPMGAVVLVDADRIWPLASFGWPLPESGRAGSFGAQVLGQDLPLMVEDALDDARFAQHPAVQGPPYLRGFAGAALVDSDQYRLGAICAFGPAPFRPGPEALTRLAGLAAGVVAVMEAGREALGSAADAPRIQGWLGVRTARANRFGQAPGLLVLSVAADSPASQAGIRPTDIILSIEGIPLRRPVDVVALLANRPAGSDVQLRLLRTGQELACVLPVASQPPRRGGSRQGQDAG